MNRDEVVKKAKLTAHEIICKWSKILIGLNKTNGAAMGSDIATAIYEEAVPRLTLEQRNRELEGEVESWRQAQSIFRQENLRLHADKAQLHADMTLAYGAAQAEIAALKKRVAMFREKLGYDAEPYKGVDELC